MMIHLRAAHDVVLVAREELVGAHRLVGVVDERDVLHVVEGPLGEEPGLAHQLLHVLGALVGERGGAVLLVDLDVAVDEMRHQLVDRDVEVGLVLQGPRDDERRARLVDEDRVDLVDDREVVLALHHLRDLGLHIVSEVVEAELVVGAVGHVAGIGPFALRVREAVDDRAGGEAEEAVDLRHPGGVAGGQVVVDGDDVDALAGQRVEVDGQRRDERLALAGLHLGDPALVQHHAADQLHVEMALAERAPRRLAHGGEGGHEEVVERAPLRELLAELAGAVAQRLVGERLDLGLERVDGLDAAGVALDRPVVGRAKNLAGDRAETDHGNSRPKDAPGRGMGLAMRMKKGAPERRAGG